MPTKVIIDEAKEVLWVLVKDDPPYWFVGDYDNKVVYAAKTGEFLGFQTKLIDAELEVYRVKRDEAEHIPASDK